MYNALFFNRIKITSNIHIHTHTYTHTHTYRGFEQVYDNPTHAHKLTADLHKSTRNRTRTVDL